MIELILPFPPSINHYWKHRVIGRRAQVYLSSEGKSFKDEVNAILLKKKGIPFFSGRIAVSITLNPPTLRKFDIDNRVKATLDALTTARVWLDDEQVDELLVFRGKKVKGGGMIVKIKEIVD